MSIRQTQTVFQSTAEFDILDTIIKGKKMLLIRLILLYCVFIMSGMSSDVNFDQFKTDMLTQFESLKIHFVSMESRIELLKVDADQCKIKTQALTEELRNHKELSRLMTVAESCLELANHGITTSKEYDLDPDGINRQILLVCHKNEFMFCF